MAHLRQSKVEEDASVGEIGADFKTARPMLNSEVYMILDHIMTQRQAAKAQGKFVNASNETMLQQTLAYVQPLHNFPDAEQLLTAKQLNEPTDTHPQLLTNFEFALICNLSIDDYDECISLIPTIRHKIEQEQITKDQLEQMLADIKQYQNK